MRGKRAQRSPIANRKWKPIHARKFGYTRQPKLARTYERTAGREVLSRHCRGGGGESKTQLAFV